MSRWVCPEYGTHTERKKRRNDTTGTRILMHQYHHRWIAPLPHIRSNPTVHGQRNVNTRQRHTTRPRRCTRISATYLQQFGRENSTVVWFGTGHTQPDEIKRNPMSPGTYQRYTTTIIRPKEEEPDETHRRTTRTPKTDARALLTIKAHDSTTLGPAGRYRYLCSWVRYTRL